MSQVISAVFVYPYSVTNGERLTCMDLTDLLSPYLGRVVANAYLLVGVYFAVSFLVSMDLLDQSWSM